MRRELLHQYLVDGLESAYQSLLSRGDDTDDEALSGSDTVAPRGTHSRTPSRSNIRLPYFTAQSEQAPSVTTMENASAQATEEHRPQVSITLPPIQPFTGLSHDHDSSGIIDFIQQIEQHVKYSYYETDEQRQAAKLSLFRRNLAAEAGRHLENLSAFEKSNWNTLTTLFIKECKTLREQ